jgi:hypothetical protein
MRAWLIGKLKAYPDHEQKPYKRAAFGKPEFRAFFRPYQHNKQDDDQER